MENLSDIQLSEIVRLLDERYCILRMRLNRFKLIASNHPEWRKDVENEMELIDSISKIL